MTVLHDLSVASAAAAKSSSKSAGRLRVFQHRGVSHARQQLDAGAGYDVTPAGRLAAAMQRYTGPYGLDRRLEDELVAACGHGGDLDILRSLAGPPAPGSTDPRISRWSTTSERTPAGRFAPTRPRAGCGCRPRTSCGCSPSTPAPPSAATSSGPAFCTQSGAWWQDTT